MLYQVSSCDWFVFFFDWLMFINFSPETTKTAAKLQILVLFTQAIYFFHWPFNKNESLIMNFTVHYKFSSMMTKDEDQVEAKGTGVIWTANQIVTYTTIETDIKVNSKTLESLTILKTWFQSMFTMVSYIMQARKKHCFRDMIFSCQRRSLWLIATVITPKTYEPIMNNPVHAALLLHRIVEWSFSSVLGYIK